MNSKDEYNSLFNIQGANNINSDKLKSLNDTVSKISESLRSKAESVITSIEITNRGCSNYNADTGKLTLDDIKGQNQIIHEYGHALAKALNIYGDDEFISILKDGIDMSNGGSLIHQYQNDIEKHWYFIQSDKFISNYQGRYYLDIDNFKFSDPLDYSLFQEYFSVGFETYIYDGELLKDKDRKLYDYIERMINNV